MDQDRMETKDREYTNGEITVIWKPSKCIHVTTCYRELIEVFNPRKRPWVNMQGAPTSEIIRVVKLCPTGALTYRLNSESPAPGNNTVTENTDMAEQEEHITEIKVMKDGPLVVKGKFKIIGAAGNELRQMKMASFCRCGKSLNMPFCDGMHRKVGFSAE